MEGRYRILVIFLFNNLFFLFIFLTEKRGPRLRVQRTCGDDDTTTGQFNVIVCQLISVLFSFPRKSRVSCVAVVIFGVLFQSFLRKEHLHLLSKAQSFLERLWPAGLYRSLMFTLK